MSEVIYLREVLLARKRAEAGQKTAGVGRPRVKSLKCEKSIKSFLVEREEERNNLNCKEYRKFFEKVQDGD
ncbi:MAG: hypothetical protein LBS14_03845 [Holosporaceae bacterium]|jgi:hypothetical protein|nr:hypothetical protein [Holosporaceae bacterium]